MGRKDGGVHGRAGRRARDSRGQCPCTERGGGGGGQRKEEFSLESDASARH
jgi:hypothetical protein